MSTTTPTDEQALGAALGYGELPPLTTTDRVALRLAVTLILRAQRRTEALERIDQARRNRASDPVEQRRDLTFEHRFQAGPTW